MPVKLGLILFSGILVFYATIFINFKILSPFYNYNIFFKNIHYFQKPSFNPKIITQRVAFYRNIAYICNIKEVTISYFISNEEYVAFITLCLMASYISSLPSQSSKNPQKASYFLFGALFSAYPALSCSDLKAVLLLNAKGTNKLEASLERTPPPRWNYRIRFVCYAACWWKISTQRWRYLYYRFFGLLWNLQTKRWSIYWWQ